jgi:RNA polymerase sigma-70 factor, ECF subfamily
MSSGSPTSHEGDLRLALACAEGDARAIARLEKEFLSEVPRFVARISRETEFIEEVQQRLRERLLVAPAGQKCRIAEYGARGPLGAWIRVAAVRVALDLKRERSGVVPSATDVRTLPRDAELDLARHRDGAAFKEALTDALGSLDADERAILRLRYVDGLTVEKVGKIYGVHAATIVRRLAASRQRVVARVRERLFATQKLRARDVDSLAELVQSQLELSLTRLLGKPRERGD